MIGEALREEVPDRVPLPRVYLAYRMPVFGTDAFDDLSVASDLLGTGRASRLYRTPGPGAAAGPGRQRLPLPDRGRRVDVHAVGDRPPGRQPRAARGRAARRRSTGSPPRGRATTSWSALRNLHAAAVESSLERIAERADRLSMYACLFDEPERINTEVSRYWAVDADRVRRAMADTLRPDNRLVLTYLPAEAPGSEEAA